MTFKGGCLCASIRYDIQRKHLNAMHCYCDMCRKAHGTAFSTHLVARPAQIVWLQGEDLLAPYESSTNAFRKFCQQCGTHMLVHGQSGDGSYAIPAGTLDGNPPLTILGHMYVSELVSWHQIHDDLPQYDTWPPGFGPDAST